MFLINSRLRLITAAPSGSRRMPFTLTGRPFSRSYGAILPSSLTKVLPIALVFSTHLPVSVLVRARAISLEAFLGGMALRTYELTLTHSRLSVKAGAFHNRPAYAVSPGQLQRLGSSSLPRPPIGQTTTTWYGISTCCPSPTPCGLGLGPD